MKRNLRQQNKVEDFAVEFEEVSGAAVGFVGVVVGGGFGVLGVGHAPFEEAGDVCVLWGEGGGEAGGELVPGVPDPEAFGEESVAGGGEGCE